ncbi:YecA family protein [Pseudalkalibacillus decolorationis]|uniref:YecA family protein n=1 Tax=Pseudalkalibacillus decolorationis TaxID=163879 RepID=UPI00214986A5|nr:SEC-C metal-binding domain-containing protein [Pseudalkalibacillus decolorationis]
MDNKTRNMLLKGIQLAHEDREALETKREKQLWKDVECLCKLPDVLGKLTKSEMDVIRKMLNLKGLSSLKKAELALQLEKLIPDHFERVLFTLDQERYNLVKRIVENSGRTKAGQYPRAKIESLQRYGIAFPSYQNEHKMLVMPEELIGIFRKTDGIDLKNQVRQNTEWITLTHGMLYYYGVMESLAQFDYLEELTGKEVDILHYIDVMAAASDYYEQVRFTGYGLADHRVFDVAKLKDEHKVREDIPYYPFTKSQLLKAGQENYVDRTPAMNDFLQFLMKQYDLHPEELYETALQYTNMIQMDADTNMMIQYFQSQFEIPSMEFMQQLMQKLVILHNNSRMWVLKGNMPDEVLRASNGQTLTDKPSPVKSNVVDIRNRVKVGRNEPCPCGSGKKYKKCCGKG